MDFFEKETYTIIDIQQLINNNTEESTYLEFKSAESLGTSDGLKKEIAKDVSAFANSDGGIIIYGLSENEHVASAFSFIDGNAYTKEQLEQVISMNVHRRIEGVEIFPIRNNGKLDETIYLIRIPFSKDAPHQSKDRRFYKRLNFKVVEMEEYEIRNLYNRQEETELEIEEEKITIHSNGSYLNKISSLQVAIQFNIRNKGKTIEKLYKLEVRVPLAAISGSRRQADLTFAANHVRNEDNHAVYSIPNKSPLFQDEFATVGTIELAISASNFKNLQEFPIYIKLYYSNGIKEKSFMLLDKAEYDGKKIEYDIFSR